MSIIDHGVWKSYAPARDDDAADEIKHAPRRAVFSKSAKGVDWYVLQKKLPADRQWIVLDPNTNRVIVAHTDVSMIFPANNRLLESDRIYDYEKELKLKIYDAAAGKFVDGPQPQMDDPLKKIAELVAGLAKRITALEERKK